MNLSDVGGMMDAEMHPQAPLVMEGLAPCAIVNVATRQPSAVSYIMSRQFWRVTMFRTVRLPLRQHGGLTSPSAQSCVLPSHCIGSGLKSTFPKNLLHAHLMS